MKLSSDEVDIFSSLFLQIWRLYNEQKYIYRHGFCCCGILNSSLQLQIMRNSQQIWNKMMLKKSIGDHFLSFLLNINPYNIFHNVIFHQKKIKQRFFIIFWFGVFRVPFFLHSSFWTIPRMQLWIELNDVLLYN